MPYVLASLQSFLDDSDAQLAGGPLMGAVSQVDSAVRSKSVPSQGWGLGVRRLCFVSAHTRRDMGSSEQDVNRTSSLGP